MEANSPTLVRETPIDKGGKLYEVITNAEGKQFNAVIDWYPTSGETFEYTYVVYGDHGIPLNYLKEILEELIEKQL